MNELYDLVVIDDERGDTIGEDLISTYHEMNNKIGLPNMPVLKAYKKESALKRDIKKFSQICVFVIDLHLGEGKHQGIKLLSEIRRDFPYALNIVYSHYLLDANISKQCKLADPDVLLIEKTGDNVSEYAQILESKKKFYESVYIEMYKSKVIEIEKESTLLRIQKDDLYEDKWFLTDRVDNPNSISIGDCFILTDCILKYGKNVLMFKKVEGDLFYADDDKKDAELEIRFQKYLTKNKKNNE